MSNIKVPADFATYISDSLGIAKSEVDGMFEVGETKDGYFCARLLPKQWLKTEQFTMLCALARDLGGDYVKEKRMWRVPGPYAKKAQSSQVPERKTEEKPAVAPPVLSYDKSKQPYTILPIKALLSMPFQSRQQIEDPDFLDLIESIRVYGILEPVLVRPKPNELYEIVAGERRARAAEKAGLVEIPAIIKFLSDQEAYECQLIENIQRRDLSDMEKARMLDYMIKKFGYLQKDLAKKLGKNEGWVSRHLAMLKIQQLAPGQVETGQVTERQARAFLAAPEEKREEILDRARETGEFPSAREIDAAVQPESEEESEESQAEEQRPFASGPSIIRRKFDVWNIAAVDVKKAFGDADYPGAIPGDIVGNVLLWFLPDGGRVVDPMAGGGVTEDVCNFLGSDKYRCFLFDSKRASNYKYRETVRFNDVAGGFLPLEDGSADLVFADPPYGPLKEYGMTTEDFERVIAGLAQASYRVLKSGGKAAVLMQNYYEGGECTGNFVPLIRRTAEIFEKHGFKQVFEGTVPLHGKVPRNEATMTHIDRRLMVFQK